MKTKRVNFDHGKDGYYRDWLENMPDGGDDRRNEEQNQEEE